MNPDAVKPLADAYMTEDGRTCTAEQRAGMPKEAYKAYCIPLYRRTPPAGWKPIETAPDDLTVIVASISINGQVNWVSDGIRGKGVMRLLWHTLNGTHVPSPTHWIGLPNDWMPLPAAPENDAPQQKNEGDKT
jgi:hypothetical protein